MHKKIASDLTSLAHSILQMKNKDDVQALKKKAYEVYEKLTLLAYVEEYINTIPQASEAKEELLEKIEQSMKVIETPVIKESVDLAPSEVTEIEEKIVEEVINKSTEEVKEQETKEKYVVDETLEQPFGKPENLSFAEEVSKEIPSAEKIKEQTPPTLEDELEDTLPVDVMADLFQKVEPQKTVNDLLQNTIKIDLNDRIAFVNHLFAGDQANFNRVVSQLNTFKTEKEAKSFINEMVKPDYDWSDKEEYETRLLEIIERRFT